ncbi:hypothetical protein [Peptoclostridium litorale]|uniref:hypothetical protein n=1 Tax=Peptoclostridium litorale TaxID=1557 RepID=UPI00056DAC58|nr:hypothetical protein [Peptoclostridium litorale]
MAKLVKPSGKIYAFDIQDMVIENTMDRLSKQSPIPEMIYIRDGNSDSNRKNLVYTAWRKK